MNLLFYVYEYLVCMCVCTPHMHAVPEEAGRKYQILWDWSYRWL